MASFFFWTSKQYHRHTHTHTAVQRCHCLNLFCVSAGSAVTVLHERVWEASACKTPDHWPVHTLNDVSLSVCRFHLYFVSFPVLSCLIVSPFIPSICLSVRLSLLLAFCGRCGLSQWLRPPAQQSSASTRCPLSPRPAPAVTCDPGGFEGPSEQCQDTLFWVEGAVCWKHQGLMHMETWKYQDF